MTQACRGQKWKVGQSCFARAAAGLRKRPGAVPGSDCGGGGRVYSSGSEPDAARRRCWPCCGTCSAARAMHVPCVCSRDLNCCCLSCLARGPRHMTSMPSTFLPHNMSGKKTNVYSTANVDSAVLTELHNVSELGVYDDLSPLVLFIQKNHLPTVLKNITYFSSVNDIGQLSNSTLRLVKVLEVVNFVLHDASDAESSPHLAIKLSLLEHRERLIEFYNDLTANHLKTVYKTFGLRKPAAINPITRLLVALVQYKNQSVFSDFINTFDFTHTTLPKLLVPTRDDFDRKLLELTSMRGNFMDLWMAICAQCSSTFRKALLTNFKVMNNFWKYVEMDRFEVLNSVIAFIEKSVLSEPSFKRSSKCQILNENFLYNFRSLFALVKNVNDRAGDDDEEDFTTFKTSYMNLMNTLVSDQARGLTYPENELGSPLVVNNRTFKINNKLIYTLLTALKPWDSYSQLQYVLTILNHNHELVPPYMNWFVASSGGYHDPSLSSYWIGHTLLYSEILNSDKLPAKIDFISLQPLSKSALTESLAYPNDLVKQLALQLIMCQLNKLSRSLGVSQSLIETVLSNLPPHASFVPLLNHENNLIKLTATMVVRKFELLAPASSSSTIVATVNKNLTDLNLDDGACDSFELILLDNYLSIQSNNDLKWWNKTAKGNSFFTSLLKLSNVSFLKSKALQILKKLTKTSLVFNDDKLIESPLLSLIEATATIVGTPSAEKLWKCLDETIARSIKTPYKYLDKSHIDYEDLSVFVVALFEQLNFVPDIKKEEGILLWLSDFMTKLAIIGEPVKAIHKIAKESGFKLDLDLEAVTPKENIISKVDFAEALLAFNKTVSLKKKLSKIFDLILQLGSFLMSSGLKDPALFKFVTDPEKWFFVDKITSPHLTENERLAITLVNELLQQLEQDFTKTALNDFVFKKCQEQLPKTNQIALANFLWIFTPDQLKFLAENSDNEYLLIQVYRLVVKKKVHVSPNFLKLLKIEIPEVKEVLSHFNPPLEQLDLIIKNPQFHFLLDKGSKEITEYILAHEISDELLYRVAATSPAIIEQQKDRAVQLALSMKNWNQSLKIFNTKLDFFSVSQVLDLLFSHSENNLKLVMTAEFVDILCQVIAANPSAVDDMIKLWFHKAMLYVTRKFAESSELSSSFDAFLLALESFIASTSNVWKLLPASIMNTQLEVLLGHKSWILEEQYLRYANKAAFAADYKLIESDKLLQIFVNNTNNILYKLPVVEEAPIRFQSALLIHTLYEINRSTSSTMTLLNQLLVLYLGSTRAEDLLIKSVLVAIEKKTTKSWVYQVSNWDFLDEISQKDVELIGEDRLIIRDKSTLVVALNKNFVRNNVDNFSVVPALPKTRKYSDYEEFAATCFTGSYQETVYDSEFLMLVMLNNEELIYEAEGKMRFNLKKIIDSGLLQFIVASLANPAVRDVSKVILHGMLKYINEVEANFKDKNIIKVYISSILHTLKVADHSTPLVWYIIGTFANIITNPGHFLYERTFRYVLATPVIKEFEIPLFHTIMLCMSNDDAIEEDDYYKQASWMIGQLLYGTRTPTDLRVLKYKDVVEWVMNLANSQYVSGQLKSKLLRLLYEIQKIGSAGADMLVTKFGALTSLESHKRSLDEEAFLATQLALNIDQIALRFDVLAQNTKRVREWTSEDVNQAVKRIHSA